MLLVVSRQPQANIIATVDGVMEQLPALRAFLPAGVSLDVASDRSPTIRATLHEAQRTLLIAVALVVFVVLLFLANFRAAMIPVTAVPVALVGSCAVMYLWGFSLNNLSLMALIVATGLVVDDAIVVLENISRHVEEGMAPMAAALQGAKEVGFTLLSMNLSLVAVFVSILFMGGIVERLFREFSITLVAAILISLVVSLTLTPMLCARWLSARRLRPGRLQRISDAVFGWLRRGYGRSLDWALGHAPIILMLFIGVAALNVHLYMKAPKSFLPDQDTGQLGGFIRGDDGMSFQIMQPKIDAFRKAVLKDPAVESVAGFIGGGRGINNAQIFVRLKPLEERMVSAQVVADRIRRNLPAVAGARMFLNVDQDIRFGGGFGRGTYSYTLRADDLGALAGLGPADPDGTVPAAGGHRHRGRTDLQPADHPGGGSRGGPSARHRDVHGDPGAQQRVRPAAGVDDLQRDEPVPRRDGGRAALCPGPRSARRGLRGDRGRPRALVVRSAATHAARPTIGSAATTSSRRRASASSWRPASA